jgi:hypothetical protein
MYVPRLLGLVATLAMLGACADSPAEPIPLDSDVIAANVAPSNGAPAHDRSVYELSFVTPCNTFLMEIAVDGVDVSQAWFHPNGAIRRLKIHVNQNVTFTNLTSGFALKTNSNHNIEVRFDENGNPTERVVNGAPQRIRDADGGRLLYFHIGHEVVTVDYSTSPPTVAVSFSGHSNSGVVSGPCEALGDPA